MEGWRRLTGSERIMIALVALIVLLVVYETVHAALIWMGFM